MTDKTQELLRELRDRRQVCKKQIADSEEEIKIINKKILSVLDANNLDSVTADGLTTQRIQNTTTEYDWVGIKQAVGMVNWKKIVKEVPDPSLLHAEINSGNIKTSKVAVYIETDVPKGLPYIKVDKAKREEVE